LTAMRRGCVQAKAGCERTPPTSATSLVVTCAAGVGSWKVRRSTPVNVAKTSGSATSPGYSAVFETAQFPSNCRLTELRTAIISASGRATLHRH
jgi:hypothetical protein